MDGRLGMDMLTGGAGSDTFMFTTELGRANVDTIADMKAGVDTIWLSGQILAELAAGTLRDAAFKDIGTLEADANDRILYDSLTGNLFYDVDGSGGEAAIKFATLTGKPEIQASDFLIG